MSSVLGTNTHLLHKAYLKTRRGHSVVRASQFLGPQIISILEYSDSPGNKTGCQPILEAPKFGKLRRMIASRKISMIYLWH